MMAYQIHVLQNGYSFEDGKNMRANCTCTLIKGPINIIVDTMTPWDRELIVEGLLKHNITPQDINYVICTHGHSDHIGNNNLFLEAKQIVGFCMSYKDTYYDIPFKDGEEFHITENIKVVPTPGHTLQDVTVIVEIENDIVAITGDLFEKEEDIKNPDLWLNAGSDSTKLQKLHRKRIIDMSTSIIPGHGPQFKVTEEYKEILKKDNENTELF